MLGVLGLDKALSSLLAGTGAISLALVFAFQDTSANFLFQVLPWSLGDLLKWGT